MSVIKVCGLTRDYGSNKGIFDINFSIEKGEVFGFLGPNVPRYEQKTLPII